MRGPGLWHLKNFLCSSSCSLVSSQIQGLIFLFPGKTLWNLLQWLSDSKKELLFLWSNIMLNSAWSRISVGRCCQGTCCNSRGCMQPPGSPFWCQISPQTTSLLWPHKSLHQTGLTCGFFVCPWQSFNWVITNRTWTCAFHTYVPRLSSESEMETEFVTQRWESGELLEYLISLTF